MSSSKRFSALFVLFLVACASITSLWAGGSVLDQEPEAIIEGTEDSELFGWNVSTAGDVNGDGYDDMVIGSPGYKLNTGRIHIFFGYPGFGKYLNTSNANVTIDGFFPGDLFGWDVAGGGDVDKDGYDDILVGAPGRDMAFVIFGNATLNSSYFNTSIFFEDFESSSYATNGWNTQDGSQNDGGVPYLAPQISSDGSNPFNPSSTVGANLTGGDDTDNIGGSGTTSAEDPYINVSANTSGYQLVHISYARASWDHENSHDAGEDFRAEWSKDDWTTTNWFENIEIINNLETGADSIPVWGNGTYFFPPSAIHKDFSIRFSSDGSWDGEFSFVDDVNIRGCKGRIKPIAGYPGSGFGTSVDILGDINNDGFSDIIVGAPNDEVPVTQPHHQAGAYIFNGSSSFNSTLASFRDSNISMYSSATGSLFGFAVAGPGDVDGDGLDDVLIGSPGLDKAFLYYGSGINGSWANVTFEGSSGEGFGFSVAGMDDNNYDNYADILIGAPLNSSSRGAAYLFYGSNWVNGTTRNATLNADNIFIGGEAGDRFGHSVAPSGDLDLDGSKESLVGAPFNGTTSHGACYLFLGNQTGKKFFQAREADGIWNGSNANDMLGVSVGDAGNLDGNLWGTGLIFGGPGLDNSTDSLTNAGVVDIHLNLSLNIPDHLIYVSGDDQTGDVDSDLSSLILLRVVNPTGEPVQGAIVNFSFQTVPTGAALYHFRKSGSSFMQNTSDANGLVGCLVHLGSNVGNYQLQVKGDNFTGHRGSDLITSINATATADGLDHVTITPMNTYPASRSISTGNTETYTAFGFDKFGNQVDSWTAVWGSSDGLGTIENQGGTASSGFTADYKAGVVLGFDNITVTDQTLPISNSSCIRIIPGSLSYISLTPMYSQASPAPVKAGGILSGFTALGYDQYGNKNLSWSPVWGTSDGLGSATSVGGTASTGFLAAYNSGSTTGLDNITVTDQQGIAVNRSCIRVIPDDVAQITLTPNNQYPQHLEVVAGRNSTDYRAIGFDQWGNKNLSWLPVWSVTNGLGTAYVTGGDPVNGFRARFVSSGTLGFDNISVASSASPIVKAVSCVKMVPAGPSSISIHSGNSQTGIVGKRLNLPMVVLVKDKFNNPVGAGHKVYFNDSSGLSGDGVFSSTNSSSGWALTDATGRATQNFILNTKAGNNQVRVEILPNAGVLFTHIGTSGSLVRLMITPGTVNITVDGLTSFNLLGFDQFNNSVIPAGTVWSSDIGAVEVSTSLSCTLHAFTSSGTGYLEARVGSVSDRAVVNVLPLGYLSIEITPASITVEVGSETQFTAYGKDVFNNSIILDDAVWTTNIGIIAFSDNERATLKARGNPGIGWVKVSSKNLTASANVVVQARKYPPIINGRVPDLRMKEDDPPYILTLTDYEFDLDDPSSKLFWYIEDVDESKFTVSGQGSQDDKLIIAPEPNAAGDTLTTLILMDKDGQTSSQPFWINITPVNDKPVFEDCPDLVIHYSFPYKFDYSPYIYDLETPDHQLNLTVDENLDEPQHSVNGLVVTYVFSKKFLGQSILVTLQVFDGEDHNTQGIFINISEDYVPELSKKIPNVVMYEGENRTNVFDLDDYFTDPDGDSIYFSYGQTNVEVQILANHSVNIFSKDDWYGVNTITFRATDPLGALAEDTITVTVLPVNDPPVISGVPDLWVHYDADYRFDLRPYISDVDNETWELRLTFTDPLGIPVPNARLNKTNNLGLIIHYPKAFLDQKFKLRITVSDSMDSSYQVINVTVTEDWPPELLFPIPAIFFNEDEKANNTINLNDHFFDVDGDLLFYSFGNTNIQILIRNNGSVDCWAPDDWFGAEYVTFRATDPTGALFEGRTLVTVIAVNDKPQIGFIPNQNREVGIWKIPLEKVITDVDDPQSELEITAVSQNSRLQVYMNGMDLIIIGTDPVETDIILNASDGKSQTSVTIPVRITEPDTPPAESTLLLNILLIILAVLIIALIVVLIYMYYGSYTVEALYLIYHDGRLILHIRNKTAKDMDEDIVSGMFVAIQDFINDTFADESKGEVLGIKKLEFGGKNILIERGSNEFLTLIVNGKPGIKLTRKMKKAIDSIEDEYPCLEDWDGVLNRVKGIEDYLVDMVKDPEVQKEKMSIDIIDLTRESGDLSTPLGPVEPGDPDP